MAVAGGTGEVIADRRFRASERGPDEDANVAGPGVRGTVQVQDRRAVHVGRDRIGPPRRRRRRRRLGRDGADRQRVPGLRVAPAGRAVERVETGEQRDRRVLGRERTIVGFGQRRVGRRRRRGQERRQR